jgi:hypothetical protein
MTGGIGILPTIHGLEAHATRTPHGVTTNLGERHDGKVRTDRASIQAGE